MLNLLQFKHILQKPEKLDQLKKIQLKTIKNDQQRN